MVLLRSGREQYNTTTTNQGHGTHTTPAETNGVGHKAEAVLITPAKTMEQPSENDVSPQARPPQTSMRSRAHKQNHPGPRTHRQVGKLHTPVPPRAGTQEWDHGTERTLKREPPEARGRNNDAHETRHSQAITTVQARATRNTWKRREENTDTTTATKPPPLAAKRGTRSPRALLTSLAPASTPAKGKTEPPQNTQRTQHCNLAKLRPQA
ncbi:hypothetical protein Taro_051260 [Colocasia esculenta]|uniref:Uncharacterized protein n=1 Tax=Colocasia esculenta TaxID=4460 RepID=A0A843XG85_COLES|nr:hypothetical protein [Colocasia esculenta]